MTQNYLTTPRPPTPFILAGLELAIDGAAASLDRLDFTLAQVVAALAAQGPAVVDDTPAIEWDDDDCVEGDMHNCPGERFHSYVEAAGAAFAMEEQAALVPDFCGACGGFHLVIERAQPAGRFEVD